MSVEIGYSRSASNTPAFALIAEGWNEIVQSGFTPDFVGTCPVGVDSEVIYAISQEGDLIGVLTWTSDETQGAYNVSLAYVEPSSRRRRVFTEMLRALNRRALEAGVASIFFNVATSNADGKAALKKLGAPEVSVVYEHAVA